MLSEASVDSPAGYCPACVYQVQHVCVKSDGLIVDVIHGKPTEDELPGLPLDASRETVHTAAGFKAIRVRQEKEGSEMPNTSLGHGSKVKFLSYYQEKQGEISQCFLTN